MVKSIVSTTNLMQRYNEYNERLKAKGVKLIAFACPACGQSRRTRQALKGEFEPSLTARTAARCS